MFIEALAYAPGVHSRRWYGRETAEDDDLRSQHVLELLYDYPEEERKAYLISHFSIADPNGNIICKEMVKNEFLIADKIDGEYGFGYDKILKPSREHWDEVFDRMLDTDVLSKDEKIDLIEIYRKKTIGGMPQKIKNFVNNRGKIAVSIARKLNIQEGENG